jgi:myo-inositol-1(or 4)-monophosphatase
VNDLESTMVAWATESAGIALEFYRNTGQLEFKHGREAVTEADRRIELLLRERIAAAFPDDLVIGEEFGGQHEDLAGRRVWHLDPIDGTLNFAVGLPGFCTSLALMQDDAILAACIMQPATGDCFTAVAGQGARLNGRAIRVSERQPLAEAIISTQFKKQGRFVQNPPLLQAVNLAALKCRRTGAIALELAWVACGGHDALIGAFDSKIHLWDVAAGLLLITEAGGMLTDHRGQPYRPGGADLVASNGLIHQEILDLVAGHPGGQDASGA